MVIVKILNKYTAPPLEEIKSDKNVTMKIVVSNCDKKHESKIKWINIDNIIFFGIDGYVIKNLKNNKETKINVNNLIPSPNGKYIIYIKVEDSIVYIYLFDVINNSESIIMEQPEFIKNESYGGESYDTSIFSPIKYI